RAQPVTVLSTLSLHDSLPISHMGVEFGFKQIVFVRAGMGNIQQVKNIDNSQNLSLQPNIGLGIKIKQFTIDYALTNINQSVGLYSNIFSLRFDINKPSS